jgi:hypothetical protein
MHEVTAATKGRRPDPRVLAALELADASSGEMVDLWNEVRGRLHARPAGLRGLCRLRGLRGLRGLCHLVQPQ